MQFTQEQQKALPVRGEFKLKATRKSFTGKETRTFYVRSVGDTYDDAVIAAVARGRELFKGWTVTIQQRTRT